MVRGGDALFETLNPKLSPQWSAGVTLYSTLGDMSLVCVGIITLFYTGLLNLAKIFLDPLDNENFSGNSFDMDIGVLVRESNEGSTRWKNAGARLPFQCRAH